MPDKEEFHNEMEALLSEWSDRIDEIRTAFDELKEDRRMKCEPEVENIFLKREIALRKLHQFDAAGENWEFYLPEVEFAQKELETAVENALMKLKHV
ncbi:MAG: hypothetical protein PHG91_06335 [Syntrophales bacterium]|nr:hypothetical protein [Syntrophales bacterium]MDD5232994.1 hypothetical protein [Syntrophales bacterium]MDD5531530.1 hypothetical protein [Syntrophales bacterium]HPL62225.1 hypothetical protein [Syntrophales bacterium]